MNNSSENELNSSDEEVSYYLLANDNESYYSLRRKGSIKNLKGSKALRIWNP